MGWKGTRARTEEVRKTHGKSRFPGPRRIWLFKLQLKVHHELHFLSTEVRFVGGSLYLNPLIHVGSQCINHRCCRITTNAISRHDIVNFLSFIIRFISYLPLLPSFLNLVMITICKGCEVGTETHGDGTAKELGETTDDDQCG